jgi:cellobiose epimerase
VNKLNEIKQELTNHIMPFWMNLKDEENGGLYGKVDYDLNVDKEAYKGGIITSRFLWTFSAAYRVTKDEKYRKYADHLYEFLVNKVYDNEYKGLYWLVDYKGNPADTRKHVYCQSFGVYALSEYYRATKKTEAFDMNTHIHVLEAYTTLYKAWPNEQLKERLENLLSILYNKMYNKETKFLDVFFDKNWNSLIDLKSFGHDIESSWLIDEAMKAIDVETPEYLQMVIDIAYNIADYAIDEDGSLMNEEEPGKLDRTKIWWVQAEAIVGFQNAYERTKDEKFLKLMDDLWEYTKNNIVDKRKNGEWLWSVEPDGSQTPRNIADPWKGSYHNGRFCLEMIERVKQ